MKFIVVNGVPRSGKSLFVKYCLDELGDFAFVDTGTVTIQPKGKNASSSVTFTGRTTDVVLGETTTFTNF